ncbi:MAG: hypothetical protein NC548_39515 [Lachnospiraceae bacterium]|nr:hypothetical protein [Lachnospiraceae bacterium]
MDSKNTPWPQEVMSHTIDGNDKVKNKAGLVYHDAKNGNKMYSPQSMMNENVAINYRTISNAYAVQDNNKEFTEYSDYLRCMSNADTYRKFLSDRKNPTYANILKYYSNETFDKEGISKYKVSDFIYLKYYNQIPNNYMITLRRYTRPCEDHMFGLDMTAEQISLMNGYSKDYFAIATAVTYMGEQTENKLSDILKFDYGANWEDKTAEVQSLQASDGGLAAQMTQRAGVSENILKGTAGMSEVFSSGGIKSMFMMSAMTQGKGVSVQSAMSSQHQYEGNEFSARYGDEFYGDVNVIQNVKVRSRGLTFSNGFSLTFEYSVKSLRCVNPKIAMMDIISNFLILTGNYGTFWGGTTIFYGQKNIAPQFGNPQLLRDGKYGEYTKSLWNDVKKGFNNLSSTGGASEDANWLEQLLTAGKAILKGGFTALLGNIFGGNVGVSGQSQIPKALLSGAPSGYWHVTVGNPLDPIAMMGNMAVTKTTVQFNDVLGYDDFPTEVKFVVDLEHCRPRDNAQIESMFNGGKGRFYSFTNKGLENAYHSVNVLNNFKGNGNPSQEVNGNGITKQSNHSVAGTNRIKTIGGNISN